MTCKEDALWNTNQFCWNSMVCMLYQSHMQLFAVTVSISGSIHLNTNLKKIEKKPNLNLELVTFWLEQRAMYAHWEKIPTTKLSLTKLDFLKILKMIEVILSFNIYSKSILVIIWIVIRVMNSNFYFTQCVLNVHNFVANLFCFYRSILIMRLLMNYTVRKNAFPWLTYKDDSTISSVI
jgi:hypothetical protein